MKVVADGAENCRAGQSAQGINPLERAEIVAGDFLHGRVYKRGGV